MPTRESYNSINEMMTDLNRIKHKWLYSPSMRKKSRGKNLELKAAIHQALALIDAAHASLRLASAYESRAKEEVITDNDRRFLGRLEGRFYSE